jgi:septal ring factor EnvC (AmiA/AmiB activator)
MVARLSALLLALVMVLSSAPAGATKLTSALRRESMILTSLEKLTAQLVRGRTALEDLKHRLGVLSYSVAEANRKLTALRKRAIARRQFVRQRLLVLYKLSRGRYMDLLMAAKDAHDMLLRAAALKRLLAADLGELKNFESEASKLEKKRAALLALRDQRRALQTKLQSRQKALDRACAKQRRAFARVRRDRKARQRLKEELNVLERALLRKVGRLDKRARSAGGFAGYRGRLPRPVGGAMSKKAVDKQTRLSLDRSGVTFAPHYNVRVRAIYPGVVRAAGAMDGYGNLVVIDHGEGYYTVYGFMSRLSVKVGQRVRLSSILGRTGLDPLSGKPAVYFELRHHDRLLDPAVWLRRY